MQSVWGGGRKRGARRHLLTGRRLTAEGWKDPPQLGSTLRLIDTTKLVSGLPLPSSSGNADSRLGKFLPIRNKCLNLIIVILFW